jgi:hypothetical protein
MWIMDCRPSNLGFRIAKALFASQLAEPGRAGARTLDNLTMALCLSVGCAVAWLLALYTERGPRLLIWNTVFGVAGAALCALVIAWIDPVFVIAGLVMAGPIFSLLFILAGQAIINALSKPRVSGSG